MTSEHVYVYMSLDACCLVWTDFFASACCIRWSRMSIECNVPIAASVSLLGGARGHDAPAAGLCATLHLAPHGPFFASYGTASASSIRRCHAWNEIDEVHHHDVADSAWER
jgi:hypothetical protein